MNMAMADGQHGVSKILLIGFDLAQMSRSAFHSVEYPPSLPSPQAAASVTEPNGSQRDHVQVWRTSSPAPFRNTSRTRIIPPAVESPDRLLIRMAEQPTRPDRGTAPLPSRPDHAGAGENFDCYRNREVGSDDTAHADRSPGVNGRT